MAEVCAVDFERGGGGGGGGRGVPLSRTAFVHAH